VDASASRELGPPSVDAGVRAERPAPGRAEAHHEYPDAVKAKRLATSAYEPRMHREAPGGTVWHTGRAVSRTKTRDTAQWV